MATQDDIREMTKSEADVRCLWEMWQEIFPKWQIDFPRMKKILIQPHGKHYLHPNGFCLSFRMQGLDGPHGKIAAVAVLPNHRSKGLGSAFVNKAQNDLKERAAKDGLGDLKSLAFGSVFPRLWCQPPIDLPQETKDFFVHRGTSFVMHSRCLLIFALRVQKVDGKSYSTRPLPRYHRRSRSSCHLRESLKTQPQVLTLVR